MRAVPIKNTEKTGAEPEQAAESAMLAALRLLDAPVVVATDDDRVRLINPPAGSLLGIEPEAAVGKRLTDLWITAADSPPAGQFDARPRFRTDVKFRVLRKPLDDAGRLLIYQCHRLDDTATDGQKLHSALLETASLLHQSSVAQVMGYLGASLQALGYGCVLVLLDDAHELRVSYLSGKRTLLKALAQVVDLHPTEWPLPEAMYDYFMPLMQSHEPRFVMRPLDNDILRLTGLAPHAVAVAARLLGLTGDAHAFELPLAVDGKPLGILVVWGRGLSPGEQNVLELFARQLATAIFNARRFEQTEHALMHSEALQLASQALISQAPLDQRLCYMLDKAVVALAAGYVILVELDVEQQRVSRFIVNTEAQATASNDGFDGYWRGLTGWVMREGRSAISTKMSDDLRETEDLRQQRAARQAGSVLVVPLRNGDYVRGTLTAVRHKHDPDFTARDEAAFNALANQVATVMAAEALLSTTARQLKAQQVLSQVSHAVLEHLDANALIAVFVDIIAGFLPEWEHLGYIALDSIDHFTLSPHPTYRSPDRLPVALLADQPDTLVRRAISQHSAQLEVQVLADQQYQYTYCVPVSPQGLTSGVILIESRNAQACDELTQRVLRTVAEQLGVGLERITLIETIRNSEYRYRTISELVSDVAFAVYTRRDGSARIAWLTGAYERILGYRFDHLASMQLSTLAHPDDLSGAAEEWRSLANGAQDSSVFEFRVIARSGDVRWVRSFVRATPDATPDGEVLLVGGIRDITEQKRAEAEVKRDLRLFEQLALIGQRALANLDEEDVVADLVSSLHDLLKPDQTALFLMADGREFLELAATHGAIQLPDTHQRIPVAGIVKTVIDEGRAIWVNDEADLRRWETLPDELAMLRVGSLLAAPIWQGDRVIGVLEAAHTEFHHFRATDLRVLETTALWASVAIRNARRFSAERFARAQAEALQRASQALTGTHTLEALFDQILDQVLTVIDFDGANLMTIGDGEARIIRTAGYDSLGATVVDYINTLSFRLADTANLNRVVTQRRPLLVVDKLAEPGWAEPTHFASWMGAPIVVDDEVLAIMCLDREVPFTDQEATLLGTFATQVALAAQNARLVDSLQEALTKEQGARHQLVQAEKLASMGRLVASVAHELNNPLQAIQNALFLVGTDPANSQQTRDDVNVALTEAERMADLIARLRSTYRPSTSDQFTPVDLNLLVDEIQRLLATHMRHRDIDYQFEANTDIPKVTCIRDQIKQVLINIWMNAVEAMPGGGTLVVTTEYTADEGGGVRICFVDTGEGIPLDELDKIFDPFYTTKDTGTGLGLAISYDIIQRHHGQIDAHSQPGEGSMVTVWLPA